MQKRTLGRSGPDIAPLVFGGNVFGWTADEATSFRLLDRFVERGFNASTPPTSIRPGAPGSAAASPRPSSATGWPGAAAATTSC